MAKVFIIIALVFMLATATLGFLAKGRIDQLQADRKSAKDKQAIAEGQAKTAKNEEEKAKKDAKDANDKAETATKLAADKTKESDESKKALDELKVVDTDKDKQITDLKAQIAALPPGAKPEELAALNAKNQELTAQVTSISKERDDAKLMVDSQSAKMKANEDKVAELERKERNRAGKLGLNGLQARILAVNAGWNFVVLSVGDKKGVSINDPLLVVRGNQPIAKLRITSVEPNTSIADVLPGSVPHGISVQPGDTVIFQGRTAATDPDKPASEVPSASAPVLPHE